jgi:DNA-binding ferritin-like protein
MSPSEILFDANGQAINPDEISERIIAFGDSCNDAVREIINDSKVLVVLSLNSEII